MQKPLVLVTGKNGQLGNELRILAVKYPQFDYLFTDIAELDIANAEKVANLFSLRKPSICINAAAYTAVDKAETDREQALKINGYAVANLAESCRKVNSRFIHISTDYVFAGTANEPYKEDDTVDPVNFYGESKLKGEELALQILPSSVIIRTSWVYSFFGHNFVKTMLRLMKEREGVSVVSDQFGSPTYAADLAAAIMHIASQRETKSGIYHYSNQGIISWFDFALAIKELARLECSLRPIATKDYPTPARRPAFSAMSKEKIKSTFNLELPGWKASLEKCLQLLQESDPKSH